MAVNRGRASTGRRRLRGAAERVRRRAEQQEERLQPGCGAIRYAEQTDGLLALVQFPEGPLRWTVFKGDEPIAAFPP